MQNTAKKGLLVLVLATITVMCAYADQPKFGFRSLWVGGNFTVDGTHPESLDDDYVPIDVSEQFFYGGGFFVALDLTFVELAYGMFWGKSEVTEYVSDGWGGNDFTSQASYISPGHEIGIYGKYPFNPSGWFHIYPLLGLNYRIASDISTLFLKVGGGFDIVSPKIGGIFRLDLMYGLRFPNSDGLNIGSGLEIRVGFHILTPFLVLYGAFASLGGGL